MLAFLAGLLGLAVVSAVADAAGLLTDPDETDGEGDDEPDGDAGHDTAAPPADTALLEIAAEAMAGPAPAGPGGDGADTISGGAENDRIGTCDGDDYVHGGAGADTIHGGPGDDRLWGGEDDDILIGGTGDDVLSGDAGADTLIGGAGADLLQGGLDDDAIFGGDGVDTLLGGMGEDMLAGGRGDDQLAGGWGNDMLRGGPGSDVLNGNAGDDLLRGDDHDPAWGETLRDYLNGGAGDDILVLGADDWGMGGEGADAFAFAATPAGPAPTVGDFDPATDRLVLSYDPSAGPAPSIAVGPDPSDAANAIVFADGQAVAVVLNGAGLTPDMIQLEPVPRAA